MWYVLSSLVNNIEAPTIYGQYNYREDALEKCQDLVNKYVIDSVGINCVVKDADKDTIFTKYPNYYIISEEDMHKIHKVDNIDIHKQGWIYNYIKKKIVHEHIITFYVVKCHEYLEVEPEKYYPKFKAIVQYDEVINELKKLKRFCNVDSPES